MRSAVLVSCLLSAALALPQAPVPASASVSSTSSISSVARGPSPPLALKPAAAQRFPAASVVPVYTVVNEPTPLPDTFRSVLPQKSQNSVSAPPPSQGQPAQRQQRRQQLRAEEDFILQQQQEQNFDGFEGRRVAQRQSGLRDKDANGNGNGNGNRRQPDVAILHSTYNLPNGDASAFDYSFESENGIKQAASGELKTVNDSQVIVMKGSYEYVGADGETYTVDWYADETGYHASAPHLPQSVAIPFPEQAAAVENQIRFAEEHPESEDFDGSADADAGSSFGGPSNAAGATRFRGQQSQSSAGGVRNGGRNGFGSGIDARFTGQNSDDQFEAPQLLTFPGVQASGPSFATPFTPNSGNGRRRRPALAA